MDAVNLNRLVYFTAVVDTGSFTKAAERLGITKTVVSQQVSKLEEELRTTLLSRTTRRVEPTEAGRLFHTRCAMILREAGDALAEVAQSSAAPSGLLRIAAPNDFGTQRIAPLVAEFMRRHPACTVDLVLSDGRSDLVADQIDLSIRIGWLNDSSAQARRIGGFRQFLVAVPALANTLRATRPDDLANAPFIANSALREPLVWRFTESDLNRATLRATPVMTTNATPAVLAAALSGTGFAVLPDFLTASHIAAGELVHVLPEWKLPSGGIHTVYPAARFRPPKVTAFVTLLAEAMKRSPAPGQAS